MSDSESESLWGSYTGSESGSETDMEEQQFEEPNYFQHVPNRASTQPTLNSIREKTKGRFRIDRNRAKPGTILYVHTSKERPGYEIRVYVPHGRRLEQEILNKGGKFPGLSLKPGYVEVYPNDPKKNPIAIQKNSAIPRGYHTGSRTVGPSIPGITLRNTAPRAPPSRPRVQRPLPNLPLREYGTFLRNNQEPQVENTRPRHRIVESLPYLNNSQVRRNVPNRIPAPVLENPYFNPTVRLPTRLSTEYVRPRRTVRGSALSVSKQPIYPINTKRYTEQVKKLKQSRRKTRALPLAEAFELGQGNNFPRNVPRNAMSWSDPPMHKNSRTISVGQRRCDSLSKPELQGMCRKYNIPFVTKDTKAVLCGKLWKYYSGE